MIQKKIFCALLLGFFCVGLLKSQSLVDIAKKEKERRESLKAKSSKVVTNADLKKGYKKEPAVVVQPASRPQKKLGIRAASRRSTPKPSVRLPVENIDQVDQMDYRSYSKNFAFKVAGTSRFVENPDSALKKPDGIFAQLGYFGNLDLEIELNNQKGNDIAVYARRPQEGILPDTMNYGVFVEDRGEWLHIGTGAGNTSPETFDMGEVRFAKKIRIVFKDYTQTQNIKPLKAYTKDYSMGIDAVESLHK
jgi:hypothetical protein